MRRITRVWFTKLKLTPGGLVKETDGHVGGGRPRPPGNTHQQFASRAQWIAEELLF